jgi:hypothetical protein
MKSIGLAIAVVIITASAVCRRSGAGREPKLQDRSQTPPRLAQEAESARKFVGRGLTNLSVRRGEPREVSALSFL